MFTVRPPIRSTFYLVFSFAIASLLGSLLLVLPGMHRGHLSFLDALFTSTSAVCVTGLTVVDTAETFTLPGKIVLLALIQVGGLGIMTFSTLFFLLFGRAVPIEESLALKESFAPYQGVRLKPLLLTIISYTLIIEAVVTILLLLGFMPLFPPSSALFHAAFHAVSAFCNAGFSDLPDGLLAYSRNYYLPGIIMLAVLAGNTGFPIIFETVNRIRSRRPRSWSLHLKLTLSIHLGLILMGGFFFFWFERAGAFQNLPLPSKLMNALFLSVSTRTAGFNLIDLTAFSEASLYLLISLMFVGACPGSTGGGVKTTTLGVLLASVVSRLRGFPRTMAFKRTIPEELLHKALTLVTLYALVIFAAQFLLVSSLPHRPFSDLGSDFLARLFEVTSALGTVGLSTGLTPELSNFEKLVIIGTMFIGRVGVLSLAILLTGLSAGHKEFYYPKEEVLLG
ncbi:MAG TPA: hypothetical protein EYP81_02800 [Thermodesulfobacteriaceae bacterium]|nr:hypothetical protein [Thermodesulfobacteriaceae bacterium]